MPDILKYLAKPRFGILFVLLCVMAGMAAVQGDWFYLVFFTISAPVAQVCLDILVDDLEESKNADQ